MAGGKGKPKAPPVDTAGGGDNPTPVTTPTATQAQQQQQLLDLQQQIAALQAQLQAAQAQQQQQPQQQPQQQRQQRTGNQQQTQPGQQPAFALNPASSVTGLLDFSNKIHVGLHAKATSSVYGDNDEDKFNLKPDGLQTFLKLIYDRGVNYNISVLQVPATMQDIGAQNPRVLMEKSV